MKQAEVKGPTATAASQLVVIEIRKRAQSH